MATLYAVTAEGRKHRPQVAHNVAAWGAVRLVIEMHGGNATREQILDALSFCYDPRNEGGPPVANHVFLSYAVRRGWLREVRA